MRSKTLWLTQTALLIALLVVLQTATAPAGQLVTGSCVNAVLAVAALVGGWSCGLTVALVSPFCAFLLGIGPQLIAIVPAIAAGNAVYVLLLAFVKNRLMGWLVGSAAKSAALYLLVVQLLCRVLPLKPPQIATFTTMFSLPQLVTALIGGAVALAMTPVLCRARKKMDKKC